MKGSVHRWRPAEARCEFAYRGRRSSGCVVLDLEVVFSLEGGRILRVAQCNWEGKNALLKYKDVIIDKYL